MWPGLHRPTPMPPKDSAAVEIYSCATFYSHEPKMPQKGHAITVTHVRSKMVSPRLAFIFAE
jgi:hypothetical protein